MILDVCVPSVISLAVGSEGGSQDGGSDGSEEGSSYKTKLFCNSLKLTEEDTTASDEMKADAAKHFRDINCTLDDACAICYLEENPNPEGQGQGQAGQGGGGEQKEYRPVPCNTPLACPITTTTTTTAQPVPAKPGAGGGDTGKRKKRQAGFQQGGGGGGGGGGGEMGSKQAYSSQAQLDFDTEANFIHQLMKVPPQYRYN